MEGITVLYYLLRPTALPGPRSHAHASLRPAHALRNAQINWMRYLSVMRRPADFSKSIDIAASVMTVLFVLTGGVGYWRLGADFDAAVPVTSIIPEGAW